MAMVRVSGGFIATNKEETLWFPAGRTRKIRRPLRIIGSWKSLGSAAEDKELIRRVYDRNLGAHKFRVRGTQQEERGQNMETSFGASTWDVIRRILSAH